jgi:hypothetical protein
MKELGIYAAWAPRPMILINIREKHTSKKFKQSVNANLLYSPIICKDGQVHLIRLFPLQTDNFGLYLHPKMDKRMSKQ